VVKKSPSANALSLVLALEEFGPAYMRWVGRHLPTHRGSTARLRLLALLAERGAMTMSALRELVGGSAQNLTGLIDAMENEGLVRRTTNSRDRRSLIVALTERASQDFAEDRKLHTARVATLFESLSAGDQAELLRIVRALTLQLSRR
jgi:DNA-binding MarR family transcriptional regulator